MTVKKKQYWLVTFQNINSKLEETEVIDEHPADFLAEWTDSIGPRPAIMFAMSITKKQYEALA